MPLLDDFYRRAQNTATLAPPPVGPDIQPAPTPMMAPPQLNMGGEGAPGLSQPQGLSQGSMQGLSQLGGAIGNKFGQAGDARASQGMYDAPMPKKRPFEVGPPFMPENV